MIADARLLNPAAVLPDDLQELVTPLDAPSKQRRSAPIIPMTSRPVGTAGKLESERGRCT